MDTFTEEHNLHFYHNLQSILDFIIIFKAFLSSKIMKEMESEWFAYFHFENQN